METKQDEKKEENAQSYLTKLPVFAKADEIRQALKKHGVVRVHADTGSGKSVVLTHLFSRYYDKVLCAQPTRKSAVGHQIYANENNIPVGLMMGGERDKLTDSRLVFATTQSLVNYLALLERTHGFQDGFPIVQKPPQHPEHAKKKKQNILTSDRRTLIVIDEAHHPSKEMRCLMGVVNLFLIKYEAMGVVPFDVVIASATPSEIPFERLAQSPVVEATGRMFPVRMEFSNQRILNPDRIDAGEAMDWACERVEQVLKQICDAKAKDPAMAWPNILVFQPGEDECGQVAQDAEGVARELNIPCRVLVCHGGTTSEHDSLLQAPFLEGVKIVVATNAIESSITVPGVAYVICTMLHKRLVYDHKGMRSLQLQLISQASARQRWGRTGRTNAGTVYAICTKEQFDELPPYLENDFETGPKALPVLDVLEKQLPAREVWNMKAGEYHEVLDELQTMGLLQRSKESPTGYVVTNEGRRVSGFPLQLPFARSVLAAVDEVQLPVDKHHHGRTLVGFYRLVMACLACSVVDVRTCMPRMLYFPIQNKRMSPREKAEFAQEHLTPFIGQTDLSTLLNVALEMLRACTNPNTGHVAKHEMNKWCVQHSINAKFMDAVNRAFVQVCNKAIGDVVISAAEYKLMRDNTDVFVPSLIKWLYMGCPNSVYSVHVQKDKNQRQEDDDDEKKQLPKKKPNVYMVHKAGECTDRYRHDQTMLSRDWQNDNYPHDTDVLGLGAVQIPGAGGSVFLLPIALPMKLIPNKDDDEKDRDRDRDEQDDDRQETERDMQERWQQAEAARARAAAREAASYSRLRNLIVRPVLQPHPEKPVKLKPSDAQQQWYETQADVEYRKKLGQTFHKKPFRRL